MVATVPTTIIFFKVKEMEKLMLTLAMIVKNEAANLNECFDSVSDITSRYVISDTGSDDDTIELVKDYWTRKEIEGVVTQDPWINFSANRNQVLSAIKDSGSSDLVLMMDADDRLVITDLERFKLLLESKPDGLRLTVEYNGLRFYHIKIFDPHKGHYVMPVHEALVLNDDVNIVNVPREIAYIEANSSGCRATDPHRFVRDALLLEGYLLDMSDDDISPADAAYFNKQRAQFYLAQSYRDAGRYREAYYAYDVFYRHEYICTESRYVAATEQARLLIQYPELGEVGVRCSMLDRLLHVAREIPVRREAPYLALLLAQIYNWWATSAIIVFTYPIVEMPDQGLFLHKEIYEWRYRDQVAVVLQRSGNFKAAIEHIDYLLSLDLPDEDKQRIISNRQLME